MNADIRKQLSVEISTMEQVIANLESVRDDEQDKFDNMPEGLQRGEKGEKGEALQTAIDALDAAISSAEEVKSSIEDATA